MESGKNESTVKETAKVVITVTDEGGRGSVSCGKCGVPLEDDASHPKCPGCGITLSGSEVA